MGTLHTASFLANNTPAIPLRHPHLRSIDLTLESLLDTTRLQENITDPLYPSYISRAVGSGLLSPGEVLKCIASTIGQVQGPQQGNARYALIRLINQSFTLWKPNPKNAEDKSLLWAVESILHTFVTDEGLLQDHILFIETFDIWNHLLTLQSLRPLFITEKEKNQGTPFCSLLFARVIPCHKGGWELDLLTGR